MRGRAQEGKGTRRKWRYRRRGLRKKDARV
jgi:hypothetical protein